MVTDIGCVLKYIIMVPGAYMETVLYSSSFNIYFHIITYKLYRYCTLHERTLYHSYAIIIVEIICWIVFDQIHLNLYNFHLAG